MITLPSKRKYTRCRHPAGCHKRARYLMGYLGDDGRVQMCYVCAQHDKLQGRHNLAQVLGITLGDAIAYDVMLDRQARKEDGV